MKLATLLGLALTALAMPIEQHALLDLDSYRVIETAPGTRELMTPQQVLELKQSGTNFMDITNHVDRHNNPYSLGVLSDNGNKGHFRNSTYPLKVHERKLFEKYSPTLSKSELKLKLTQFSSFYTRYARSDTGLESSMWLHDKVQEIAEGRDDIKIRLVDHEWQQKSLVASIAGTETPEKVVVVGAHQDSINLLLPGALPAPGADDDGSGSVTILEVFRTLISSGFKPKNTLEFHWYSNEELGLLGSQDIFAEYADTGVDVRAMLQQDMTGYSAGSKAKNDGQDQLGVIVDYVDPALTEFIKLLITEYCSIPYIETQCGYACSDHGSASKFGYQSAFVIESEFKESNHKIHTTEDKVEYLDFEHMLEHAKLTLGYALELSNNSEL